MADPKSMYPKMTAKNDAADKKPDPAPESKAKAEGKETEGTKVADESGGDALNTLIKRHATERKDMHGRHEKERRDLHGTMRDQMRAMLERHETEVGDMNTRHLSDMGGMSPPGSTDAEAAAPGATPAADDGKEV